MTLEHRHNKHEVNTSKPNYVGLRLFVLLCAHSPKRGTQKLHTLGPQDGSAGEDAQVERENQFHKGCSLPSIHTPTPLHMHAIQVHIITVNFKRESDHDQKQSEILDSERGSQEILKGLVCLSALVN